MEVGKQILNGLAIISNIDLDKNIKEVGKPVAQTFMSLQAKEIEKELKTNPDLVT